MDYDKKNKKENSSTMNPVALLANQPELEETSRLP